LYKRVIFNSKGLLVESMSFSLHVKMVASCHDARSILYHAQRPFGRNSQPGCLVIVTSNKQTLSSEQNGELILAETAAPTFAKTGASASRVA
jgi:hypothetical protein